MCRVRFAFSSVNTLSRTRGASAGHLAPLSDRFRDFSRQFSSKIRFGRSRPVRVLERPPTRERYSCIVFGLADGRYRIFARHYHKRVTVPARSRSFRRTFSERTSELPGHDNARTSLYNRYYNSDSPRNPASTNVQKKSQPTVLVQWNSRQTVFRRVRNSNFEKLYEETRSVLSSANDLSFTANASGQ